jgi:nucleotide-binding universal stress UspA family protein
MFTRIVVGLDGSDHSRKALAVAIGVAKNEKAGLLLVRALSTEPLSQAERELAETEFGFKDLDEPSPASALTDANADPRLRYSVGHANIPNARLKARADMAQASLQSARGEAISAGVTEVEIHVEFGDPTKVILGVAKDEKADLIVLGSRGLSNIEGLVFGSTSHKVAHLAPCSCLTVT